MKVKLILFENTQTCHNQTYMSRINSASKKWNQTYTSIGLFTRHSWLILGTSVILTSIDLFYSIIVDIFY